MSNSDTNRKIQVSTGKATTVTASVKVPANPTESALEAALEVDASMLDVSRFQTGSTRKRVDLELSFPEISANAGLKAAAPAAARDAKSSTGGKLPDANGRGAEVVGNSSLLTKLRQQAEAKLRQSGGEQDQRDSFALQADAALRQIFHYCNDLVQQLNVLRPPVSHQYLLAGTELIRDLVWEGGFVDYRTQVQSAGAQLESVSLSFHANAPRVLQIEREAEVAERFRRALFDANLAFTLSEVRNQERNYVEKVIFNVPVDVRSAVLWQPDAEHNMLKMEIRHVQRFGIREFLVPVSFFDTVRLDEFACFLLGQANQFLRHLQNLRIG